MLKSQISRTGFDRKQKIKNISKFIITAISVTVVVFLSVYSCKDKIIAPIEDQGPKPGRRDYTWSVDTINIPFMSFARIWGSSSKNVWIVGPGGGLDKTIFHYDGTSWKTDGISRGISPASIWGFGGNNVWLGGLDGEIWHFDGNNWMPYARFETTREKNIGFQEIWGDSPDNIFAAGYSGDEENRTAVIAHYDGISWKLTDFTELKRYNFLRIRRSNIESSEYFIDAIKDNPTTGDSYSIFTYKNGKQPEKIYEGQAWAFIQKIDNIVYFMIDKTINTYSNKKFIPFLKINLPNFGGQIFGRNSKDILIRMFDGIAHYNGTDVKYIYHFDNGSISITDGVVFDKEVFFLAIDRNNSNDYIIHGKLKQ